MKKMQIFVIALTCLFSLCSISFAQSVLDETIDGDNETPHQRNGMHACPDGKWVTGFHLNRNLLLCSKGMAGIHVTANLSKEIVDGDNESPTQREYGNENYLHACPRGYAITGIHVEKNLLSCAPFFTSPPYPNELYEVSRTDMATWRCDNVCQVLNARFPWDPCVEQCKEIAERATQRQGMHACKIGHVLTGIDAKKNVFLCAHLEGMLHPEDY